MTSFDICVRFDGCNLFDVVGRGPGVAEGKGVVLILVSSKNGAIQKSLDRIKLAHI